MAPQRLALTALFVCALVLVASSVFDQIRDGVRDAKIGCPMPQDAIDNTDRTVFLWECCGDDGEHAPDYYLQGHPLSPTGVMAVYEHIYEYYWGVCANCFNDLREVCENGECSRRRVCAVSDPMMQGTTLDGTPLPEPGPLVLVIGALAVAALAWRRV